MKTITVKQPWAWLQIEGIKDIENRTWPTNYRGRVLIHAAAKSWTWNAVLKYLTAAMAKVFNEGGATRTWLDSLNKGEIIGSVEIVDCVINHPSIWAERHLHHLSLTTGFLPIQSNSLNQYPLKESYHFGITLTFWLNQKKKTANFFVIVNWPLKKKIKYLTILVLATIVVTVVENGTNDRTR